MRRISKCQSCERVHRVSQSSFTMASLNLLTFKVLFFLGVHFGKSTIRKMLSPHPDRLFHILALQNRRSTNFLLLENVNRPFLRLRMCENIGRDLRVLKPTVCLSVRMAWSNTICCIDFISHACVLSQKNKGGGEFISSWLHSRQYPTDPFTVLEPRNPMINEFPYEPFHNVGALKYVARRS